MARKRILGFVIGCLALFGVGMIPMAQAKQAKVVHLTSCNWEPYNGISLPKYGFTSEIIRQAFKRVGYDVTFTFLPWKRAMEETRRGKYNAIFAAYYSEERAKTYALSAPYFSSILVLCKRRDSPITYEKLEDLKPYRIGVVRGYVNTEAFDKATYLKKEETSSDLTNLKKLIGKRLDLIVIDKYLALYHLKNSPVLEAEVRSIAFLDPPLAEQNLYMMFSRAVPGYQQTLKDFNRGLKAIQEDGTLDQILTAFGFLK